MPTISGNIGELISFDVQNAGSVTGVSFGEGFSNSISAQTNNSTLNATIPTDASWDYVTFYKRETSTLYNALGTGYKETGAYNNLEGHLSASGLLGACASGAVTYSNLYEASGICTLTATGTTENITSGKLYTAYNSGLCGADLNGYTNRGYSVSDTRLSDFNIFVDDNGDWQAVGNVQYTGNFVYKKAALEVTCIAPTQESTNYKFVPIPTISTFDPQEGEAGRPIQIYGNVFADVSNVSISGVTVPFNIDSNTKISGTIPAGTFSNKIEITGPSGVKAYSVRDFVSLDALVAGTPDPNLLELASNQSFKKNKGEPGSVYVLGKNITALTTGYLTNESNEKFDLLSNPNFSYTSTYLQFPTSTLDEGIYDVTVANVMYGNVDVTSSIEDTITVLDSPLVSYSYSNVSTTGLINEPALYDSSAQIYGDMNGKKYPFTLDERVNRVCLTFKNNNIKNGSVKYKLQRDLGNNLNASSFYYIDSFGPTEALSEQKALNMFGSGIYTRDVYGDPHDSYAYKLNPCACKIQTSGTTPYSDGGASFSHSTLVTGVLVGDVNQHPHLDPVRASCRADFAIYTGQRSEDVTCVESGFIYTSGVVGSTAYGEMTLSTTGLTTGQNATYILQQLQPGYTIASWEHTAGVHHEEFFYKSGISYPFLTFAMNNYASEPWENILHSGINDVKSLDPSGYEEGSLFSGYSIENSSSLTYTDTLIATGQDESAAQLQLILLKEGYYSQCETGNYSATTVYITGLVTKTGLMYGYC